MESKSILLSCCLVVVLLGIVRAQNENLLDPDQINQKVQASLNSSDIKSAVDKAEDAFWKKCQNVAKDQAQEVFNKTKEARIQLKKCFETKVNMTELQAEMNEAQPKGDLDEVFKKYCNRKGDLQKCLFEYTATLEPCLSGAERDSLKVVHNITEQLSSFICFNDGDRIALFIAENGPACLADNNENIMECVQNYTNAKDFHGLNSTDINVDDFAQFNLEFNKEACMRMSNLKECVVNHLKKCSEPTPSNIADALFKYVQKATPCGNMLAPASKQTAAASSAASHGSFIGAALLSALAVVLF